jgi:WXG100 family type VII secretion target
MATIHVNTDVMRYVANCFYQLNEQLEDNTIPQIRNGISQLEADWQGVSRQHYEQLFHEWESHARQLAELGERIAQHLRHTADAFDQADHS